MRPGSPAACFHASNLLTYASVASGLMAVGAAAQGSWSAAGALIALAALADTFDGRFARLFRRTAGDREFGAQIDSLSDAVTFGFAPVAALYLLLPAAGAVERAMFGAAALAYVLAAITRLGYFNLAQEDGSGFIGLPAPAAGLIVSSALLARPSAGAAALLALCVAVAMVSSWKIPRPAGAALALFALWPVSLVVLHGMGAAW